MTADGRTFDLIASPPGGLDLEIHVPAEGPVEIQLVGVSTGPAVLPRHRHAASRFDDRSARLRLGDTYRFHGCAQANTPTGRTRNQ